MVTESGKMAAMAPGSSNNLAMVVDRRPPHRPGGCAGIFFQLFDWNRRLANKKFFSRKLLPQVRAAKKISKKFGGDERMPAAKLLLIAEENRGGFPTTKKWEGDSASHADRGSGMCTPSLVARLMGLESMPAGMRHDKPRKAVDGASSSSSSSNGGCYFDGSDASGSSWHYQDLGLGSGGRGRTKLERRPQKLQKTGAFDRQPVVAARVSSEALPCNRSLLARSRKRHHYLASPVKSPRLLGRRSSARLMEAAARILEPGLQSRNRARCSLTYAAPSQANMEGADKPLLLQRPSERVDAPVISPCKNSGNLVQVPETMLKPNESSAAEFGSSSTSDFSNTSSHDGFNETVPKVPVVLKDERRVPSLAIQVKANARSIPHGFMNRKSRLQNEFENQMKPQQDAAASTSALKQNNVRPNEMPLITERVAPAPKLGTRQRGRREPRSWHESKDLVASNINLNNRSWTTTTKITDSQRMEMEGNACDKKSLVRKRRSIGNITQRESTTAVNSTLSKQRTGISEAHNGKGARLTCARSIHGSSGKSALHKVGASDWSSSSKNGGIVSFRFSTSTGNNALPSGSVSERNNVHLCAGISQYGTSTNNSKTGKLSCEGVPDKTIDALSALLEQKIRELACSDLEESASGDDVQSRSSAAILEGLIAALTTAQPMPQKKECDSAVHLRMEDEPCYNSKFPSKCANSHGQKVSIVQKFQTEAKAGISPGILHYSDYDQPSPVSILEASFSNDSCFSESFNSSSGYQPEVGFIDGSLDKSKSWELDADLSDSATSTNGRKIDWGMTPLSLDNISIMNNINLHGTWPAGSELDYVREVISNADLSFGSIFLDKSDGKAYSSIDLMLLDTTENLLDAFWEGSNSGVCFSETNEKIKFRRFLFDCMVEHLEVKYSNCCTTGYKAWMKLPLLTRDTLMQDISKEIISCRDLAGKILDEIVEKDMSCMNRKWTDFETETFEAGTEIGNDLLQLIVDETVNDLWC